MWNYFPNVLFKTILRTKSILSLYLKRLKDNDEKTTLPALVIGDLYGPGTVQKDNYQLG